MKKYILTIICALSITVLLQAQETASDGLLPSRKTTAERLAMPANIAAGIHVYDTDTKSLWYWDGTVWVENSSSANSDATDDAWVNGTGLIHLGALSDGTTARPAGTEFVALDNGSIGIGTTIPNTDFNMTVKARTIPGPQKALLLENDNDEDSYLLAFKAGNTTNQRRYIEYLDHTDTRTNLLGVNANNSLIFYDVAAGVHPLIASTSPTSPSRLSSPAGANNPVMINWDGANVTSDGGLSVLDGSGLGTGLANTYFTTNSTFSVFTPDQTYFYHPNNTDVLIINQASSTRSIVESTLKLDLQSPDEVRIRVNGGIDAVFGETQSTFYDDLRVNKKVSIGDLTGTVTATDVIVTADATTGELKEGGTLATIGSKWTNDNANTRTYLTNLSDGTTVRPAGTEFVALDNGNVGIGTTTPADRLDVEGDISLGTATTNANGVIRKKNTIGALDFYSGTTFSNGAKMALTAEDYSTPAAAGRIELTYGGGTAGSNGETNGYLDIVKRSNTGLTSVIRATPNTYVGIGTETPAEKLDVTGKILGDDLIQVDGETDGALTSLYARQASTAQTGSARVVVRTGTGGGSIQLFEENATGDYIPGVIPHSRLMTVSAWSGSTDNMVVDAGRGDLHFVTGNPVKGVRMTVKDNGNVGIGTTAPSHKLVVVDNSDTVGLNMITRLGNGVNYRADIEISGNAALDPVYDVSTNAVVDHTFSNESTELMRITDTGNVGIGTDTPTSKLQVVGLPEYATVAAAQADAGLTAGAFYVLNAGTVEEQSVVRVKR